MIPREILKKVKQIEIRSSRAVDSSLAGAYSSSFKGKGMEFSEVREYVPGDEVRSIDWNVTARTGKPHIKQFVEERELTVLLCVDASSSGEFGSQNQMKGEVMATLSSFLAFTAVRNNDRVGLLIFTDEIETFIPPQKGRKHVLRVIRELLYFKPKSKGTDLNKALQYVNKVLKRKSVVILLSDFQTEQFETPLKLLGRKHDTVAIGVTDPREKTLPAIGFIELEDAETGEVVLVDTGSTTLRELFAKEVQKENRALQRLFKRMQMDFVEVTIGTEFEQTVRPLVDYFIKRSARIGKN